MMTASPASGIIRSSLQTRKAARIAHPGSVSRREKQTLWLTSFNTHVKSASPPISASCVLLAMRVPLVNETAN